MLGVVADRQQAAVHQGMQRLDPAIHHFGKAGDVGDVAHRQPGIGQRLTGAAGGDQFHALLRQRAGELDQPGLVGHGQQSAGNAAQ